jgi:hypothetical protein
MPRLLAIAVGLLIIVQSVVAMARPVQRCCHEACDDQVMCVVHACQSCAQQAVLPAMPLVGESIASDEVPELPAQALLIARLVEIWRPPPLMQVHMTLVFCT